MVEGKKRGDTLPKERDLISIFRVSKGTVCESLQSLDVLRLIRLQTGPIWARLVKVGAAWGCFFFSQGLAKSSETSLT
jgi:DNA-binding transcriptional MocR family regulator